MTVIEKLKELEKDIINHCESSTSNYYFEEHIKILIKHFEFMDKYIELNSKILKGINKEIEILNKRIS